MTAVNHGRSSSADQPSWMAPRTSACAGARSSASTRRRNSAPGSGPSSATGSGSSLTGRSRSTSAIPAMPCTIGNARWSPSYRSTMARQSVADAIEWPQPKSAGMAPKATASHTSSPGLASARASESRPGRPGPRSRARSSPQAGHEARPQFGRVGLVERHGERAVATDRHRMRSHVLLTEDADTVVDAELPVVPAHVSRLPSSVPWVSP